MKHKLLVAILGLIPILSTVSCASNAGLPVKYTITVSIANAGTGSPKVIGAYIRNTTSVGEITNLPASFSYEASSGDKVAVSATVSRLTAGQSVKFTLNGVPVSGQLFNGSPFYSNLTVTASSPLDVLGSHKAFISVDVPYSVP